MGIFDFFRGKSKSKPNLPEKNDEHLQEVDRSNWTGEDFEFLITGDIQISNEEFDQIMTPNSMDWNKIIKNDWPYYIVGEDEFSFSTEIPGIQFTFNKEVKFQKAKSIADEIILNLHSIGQEAELVILKTKTIYRFD